MVYRGNPPVERLSAAMKSQQLFTPEHVLTGGAVAAAVGVVLLFHAFRSSGTGEMPDGTWTSNFGWIFLLLGMVGIVVGMIAMH